MGKNTLLNLSFNKKGDFPSMLFAVIIVVVMGIIIFFANTLTDQIYTAIDEAYLNESYQGEPAQLALQDIQNTENLVWDYAFLGLFFGVFLSLGLTSYATRISPVFYWIYGILSLVILMVGTVMSNLWQEAASNPEFATSITRFPITNAILGTYYPTIVTGIIAVIIVLMFAKAPGGEI